MSARAHLPARFAQSTPSARATCLIDPNRVLRATAYHPMSNGRTIDGFVCLLQAMQSSDADKVATPEGSTPGCNVIVPAPKTPDAIAERRTAGLNTGNRSFTTRKRRPIHRSPETVDAVSPSTAVQVSFAMSEGSRRPVKSAGSCALPIRGCQPVSRRTGTPAPARPAIAAASQAYP
jgi:C-terminal domain of 1-Cys peroxiredoxin